MNPSDEESVYSETFVSDIQLPSQEKDEQFDLLLNYADPFFKKTRRKKAPVQKKVIVKKRSIRQKKPEKKPEKIIVWPTIKYQGIMKSSNSAKKTALVTIDNRVALVKDLQEVDNIKVLQIFQDSIQLKYEDEIKSFYK